MLPSEEGWRSGLLWVVGNIGGGRCAGLCWRAERIAEENYSVWRRKDGRVAGVVNGIRCVAR